MERLRVAIIVALIAIGLGLPALAQDVTLTSRDGKVSVSGRLLTYDGEFFRIDSEFGALTLDGTGVTCAGTGCPDLQAYVAEFTIAGAQAMGAVLLPALVESFAAQSSMKMRRVVQDDAHFTYVLSLPDTDQAVARIGFRLTNTDGGFADMLAGQADMVLATREVTKAEAKAAKVAELGNMTQPARSRIVGLDGLVPVVAPDNPVRAISLDDLARLFAGQISNWQEIGGPDAPVYLHMMAADSGLAQQFMQKVMGRSDLQLSENIVRHSMAAELVDAVAKDPFAVGISRFSELGNARKMALHGACGMDFAATRQSLKTEDYPLAMPLFLYTPARRLPKTAREFLAFLRSPAAQRVVRRVGFVDQQVGEVGIERQGQRLANAIALAGEETPLDELQRMVNVLRPAKRLTVTFRFETGSTKLDAQSRGNVVLLARLLEAGYFGGRELMFVGFSDGEGDAAVNRKIAKRRAATVRTAVTNVATTMKTSELLLSIEGFGEALPMACDDSDWGRGINRRVEVWVK